MTTPTLEIEPTPRFCRSCGVEFTATYRPQWMCPQCAVDERARWEDFVDAMKPRAR